MKILVYQPRVSYYTGGGEVYPLQNVKFFAKLGHDVTLLTTKASFIEESAYFKDLIKENPDIKVEYLNLDDNFRSIYENTPGINWERWDQESLYVARLAYQYIEKNNFDIISIHNVIDTLAVPFNCKHVLHLHGAPSELNYLCKLILQHEKKLIAVSNNVAKKWKEMGAYPEIKICTNAIDENVFYYNPNIERNLDLLFVGRLILIKGVQTILKSLKLLKEKYNMSPKLRIIGQGPYKEELENMVDNLELNSQIEFCGLVSQEFLVKSYQSAKLAVLPSYSKEGIMTTLLEAASCKTPAITTRGTSMEEFAKKDENAILVNSADEQDLCEKIYEMLTNKKLSNQIAENALKEVKKHYTWLNKTKQIIDLYKEFIDE